MQHYSGHCIERVNVQTTLHNSSGDYYILTCLLEPRGKDYCNLDYIFNETSMESQLE